MTFISCCFVLYNWTYHPKIQHQPASDWSWSLIMRGHWMSVALLLRPTACCHLNQHFHFPASICFSEMRANAGTQMCKHAPQKTVPLPRLSPPSLGFSRWGKPGFTVGRWFLAKSGCLKVKCIEVKAACLLHWQPLFPNFFWTSKSFRYC